MFNINPTHWQSLFTSLKNDFESMTISRCLAIIGLDIQSLFHTINIILTSLSNQTDSKKITLELLHRELNFVPDKSYIKFADNLRTINNISKVFSHNYFCNLSITSSIYASSLSRFTFNFFDSMISTILTYFGGILNIHDFPLRERIILFRKGIEKIRVAPDSSPFKRLIIDKIDFLTELSFYASNFLKDEFQMSQFFVDFLKYDKKKYEKAIHNIYNSFINITLIDQLNRNYFTRPIGKFLSRFVLADSFVNNINSSLRFLFNNQEEYKGALKKIIDFSNDNHEIPTFVKIQKSLQKIMSKKSTFEKEFFFNASKTNRVLKDLKEMSFRQFLIMYGNQELSSNLNDFAVALNYFSQLQSKYFPKHYPALFAKIKNIVNLLKNPEVKFSSLIDEIDDGASIVIDVIYSFTKSIIDKKDPKEAIKSISKSFLDVSKTINNIINFDKKKPLSFKYFIKAIQIKSKSNLKAKKFTFFDVVPLDKIYNCLTKLAPIAKEKNDITFSDLKKGMNISDDYFNDFSHSIKQSMNLTFIDIIKSLVKRYVYLTINIDFAFEKVKEVMKNIIEDKKIGVSSFDLMIATFPPSKKYPKIMKIVNFTLPIFGCIFLITFLIVIIVLRLSKEVKMMSRNETAINCDLSSQDFNDDDLLLQNGL